MNKTLILISVFVFALSFCGTVSAVNGPTELVSADSAGVPGNGGSYAPHISAHEPYISEDGRYVAFESYASNLVPGTSVNDTIYVKDMQTGEVISVGFGDTPLISGDGRYVAFKTANKLVSTDTNGMPDVYVYDIKNKVYTIVSVSSSGTPGNNVSYPNCISRDGRYVTFDSSASNLVPNDTNGCSDIFVRDLVNKKTTRVSVSSSGAQANGGSSGSAISADGRYVTFGSGASNLVSGDTNGLSDVFVRDMTNNTTIRVSISSSGAQANGGSYPDDISADGHYIAFDSVANNLVSGDANGCKDVFVYNMVDGKTFRVSLDSNGNQFFYDSCWATISADGRYVAFYSGDYPMNTDIYVRDVVTLTTDQITNCEKNRNLLLRSVAPTISTDGKYLAFQSYDKLVAGLFDVKPNIFRVKLDVDTAPTVVSTNPTSSASGVSIQIPVNITFSEDIVAGANYSGIYIKNLNSGTNLSISKSISGKTLTVNHTNPLKTNTQYKVCIPAGAVKDAAGNGLASNYIYTFNTSQGSTGDTTPPTVINTDPTNNTKGVQLKSPVTITFSENIISGSKFSGIYIKNLTTGTTVSIASKTINGNTLTIKPTNSRIKNCQYKVYLPAGAVKDTAGNGLASNYIYTFTTEPYPMIDSGSATFYSNQDKGNVTYTWETYQKSDGTIIVAGTRKNPVKTIYSNFYIKKTSDNTLYVTWETQSYFGNSQGIYSKTTKSTAIQYYWNNIQPNIRVNGDTDPTIWDPSLHQ